MEHAATMRVVCKTAARVAAQGAMGTGFRMGETIVNRAVFMTVGGVVGWYRQTLDGSFSSVSRPIFASKYSFFSIFRDLQDLHTFAPLQIQNFSKFSSTFFSRIFQEILEFLSLESEIRNFSDWILRIFVGISRNLSEFSKI